MTKTVTIVGNFTSPWTTENDVKAAFSLLGWTVVPLQENGARWEDIRRSAFESDLLLWIGTWDEAQPLRETVDTIRQCGMRGIKTGTLHLDIFFGSDRGARKWWLSPMFQTAHVFTADGSHEQQWRDIGVNHHWLRPAVRYGAVETGTYRAEYACDVAFVGSNGVGYHEAAWPYRKQLLAELRRMCRINGWSFRNPGGDDPKIDRGMAMNDFYASARVTVGDSLCLDGARTLYCSDRAYEAPGRGGLLIMPQLDFLDEDFYGGLPMYPWGDWSALEWQIRHFIEDERDNRITREATQELVGLNHTYCNRVTEMLEVMGLREVAA